MCGRQIIIRFYAMRIHLTMIALIVISFSALKTNGQTSFQWAKTGTSVSQTYSEDIGTDRHGNVYMLLNTADSLVLNSQLTALANSRNAVASWDCNGNFRWLKVFRSILSSATAMQVDTFGNVYITGEVRHPGSTDTTFFDTDTSLAGTMLGLYIIKYDSIGDFKWLKMPLFKSSFSVSEDSRSLDLSVTPDGKIFWYAYLNPGSYDNNAFTLSSKKYCAVTYSTSGTFQHLGLLDLTTTKSPPVANGAELLHFSRDHKTGRHYLGGTYNGANAGLGSLTIGSTSVVSSNINTITPMFLAAFDSLGKSIWVKQGSSDKISTIECRPAVDLDGNIFIGGSSQPANVFSGDTLKNNLGLVMSPFLMSLDSSGNRIWTSAGNTAGVSRIDDIYFRNNTLAAVGTYVKMLQWGNVTTGLDQVYNFNHFFQVRFNAATGVFTALDTFVHGTLASSLGNVITIDENSNCYSGGLFVKQVFVGTSSITSQDTLYYDLVLSKYGTAICNCDIPKPEFTHTQSGNTYNFVYTGTLPYNTISWDFGDGSIGSNTTNPTHHYTAIGKYLVCVTVTNGCGTNTACHTASITTGIADIFQFSDPLIYPNPATAFITIDNVESGSTARIINTVGVLVFHTKLHSTAKRIDVSTLSPGLYFVHFGDKTGKQRSAKFVKL